MSGRNLGGRPPKLRDPVRVFAIYEQDTVRAVDRLVRRFGLVLPSRNDALRELVDLALENLDLEELGRRQEAAALERSGSAE